MKSSIVLLHRRPLALALGSLLVYVLAFFLLYPRFKEASAAFVVLPVAVIAWRGGVRPAFLASILSFPLNTLLLNLAEARARPWSIVLTSGGAPGIIAVVFIGWIIGVLHDNGEQFERELAQRKEVERTLVESELRYRKLFESAERQARELALLDRVRQALAREVELPLVFRTVVEGIAETFGYTQVSLYLLEGDVLRLQHQIGYDHVIDRIALTEGIMGRVARSQRAVLLQDVRTDPAFLGAMEGITSEVCVPLFNQDRVAGVLNVESTQGIELAEADLQLMTALAEQIGIALSRAHLYSEVSESEHRFRQLAEHIEQVFWLEDLDQSLFTYISPAYEMIWGRSPRSLYEQPQSWLEAVHPDDLEAVGKAQSLKVTGEYDIEYRIIQPNGSVRWVWSRAFPIRDGQGNVYRIAGIAEDVTERKEAEAALRQSEERFKLMAWATKDAVWDWDLRTNEVWWGEGLQKIFHYSLGTVETNYDWWFEHIHPQDQAKVHKSIQDALQGGLEFWSKEYRFQRNDGTYADIMGRGYLFRDGSAQPYRMVGAMIDITERKYMELTLLRANEQMQQILNELQGRNREIVLLNEMSHRLQACQSEEQAYRIIADLAQQLFPHTSGAFYLLEETHNSAHREGLWGELPLPKTLAVPDGCRVLQDRHPHLITEDQDDGACLHLERPYPAISYCVPLEVQGDILGILLVQSQQKEALDESKRRLAHTVVEQAQLLLSNLKLRKALLQQAIHDPLTGLYNRRYMEEALSQQLSRVTRQLHPLGIIMIDIDHFKLFNDTHGHAAGDALLESLGHFLQSHIRGEDIACRYGGEEFILILPDVAPESIRQRAEHLRDAAHHLQVPGAGQQAAGITLSMGISIYPQHGRNIPEVLRAADRALYEAKRAGRDRVMMADGDHV